MCVKMSFLTSISLTLRKLSFMLVEQRPCCRLSLTKQATETTLRKLSELSTRREADCTETCSNVYAPAKALTGSSMSLVMPSHKCEILPISATKLSQRGKVHHLKSSRQSEPTCFRTRTILKALCCLKGHTTCDPGQISHEDKW